MTHRCGNRRVPVFPLIIVAVAVGFALAGRLVPAADVSIPQLQAAAEKGHVRQELKLAAAYFTGRGVNQDIKLAAYWYQKAAGTGNPEAENEIGFFYNAGIGVPKDLERAVHWYRLAAASGSVEAKVNLGVLYAWGIGVEKNQLLAAQLFQEAANKGSGPAATYLGDIYYCGMGVKQDKAAGEAWFVTAVKLNDPVGANNLASLFYLLPDHPRDLAKAARLFRRSASGGYVPAMHTLGLLLVNHPELASSPQEALPWLEQAADAGMWKSSVVLGVLARDGLGVAADPASAYYHFQIAIRQGGEPAEEMLQYDLEHLPAKLSPGQIKDLTSNADSWFQQHQSTLLFVYKNGENWKFFPSSAQAVPTDGIHAGQLIPLPPA